MTTKDSSYLERYESFADKLVRHHREPGKFALSPEEQMHWDRINVADDLLRKLYPQKTVARLLLAKYESQGLNLSTAYRDIALAKKIFAYRDPDEKAYLEKIMIDKLLKMLQQSMISGDGRAVAAISREIREWLGKDGDMDPKLLKGNTFIFNVGGKTVQLESTEDVPSIVLDSIINDGDIFNLPDDQFLDKIKD